MEGILIGTDTFEYLVQSLSLTERETEAQKEGRPGSLSHDKWTLEKRRRPDGLTKIPIPSLSRLPHRCVNTCNFPGPMTPLPPLHQRIRLCTRAYMHVRTCTRLTPSLLASRTLPASGSGWGAGGTSEG